MSACLETPAEVARMQATLHRIAEVLNVPVATFTGPDAAMMGELLRLWHAMPSAGQRQQLLAKMREVAGGSHHRRSRSA